MREMIRTESKKLWASLQKRPIRTSTASEAPSTIARARALTRPYAARSISSASFARWYGAVAEENWLCFWRLK